MANKGTVPLPAKVGPPSKRPKSSGSEVFAVFVLEFLMRLFPSVTLESMSSDIVATAHAIIFLLMQNVNIYRLNFHSWNVHVFALSFLLLSRAMVSHWMLRMRRSDDVGSQHWWIRLVVPISFLLNLILLVERVRSMSVWASLAFGAHATLCFAPIPWGSLPSNSDASLGLQLNARLRSFIMDGFSTFLLSSVYPMLNVRDPHLHFDKARCLVFAFTCLLSCAAVGVTRACVAAYLPFLAKGGSLGSWFPKAEAKTSASGKFSSVRPWSGEKLYVKGDLVTHHGRVHECATQCCSLEPQSWLSVLSCSLFSQPLVVLNAATVVLAAAVALLLWMVRLAPFIASCLLLTPWSQAFTSVSWTACWVVVNLHYGIIVWLLRQRPLVMPPLAAALTS